MLKNRLKYCHATHEPFSWFTRLHTPTFHYLVTVAECTHLVWDLLPISVILRWPLRLEIRIAIIKFDMRIAIAR